MATTTVGTTAALTAALKLAKAGDTIQLQAGTYSGVELKFLNLGTGVTITSADPSHKAVLANLLINEVTGLNFKDLEIQVSGSSAYGAGVNVYSSSNISFDKVFVHGSLDGDASNDTGGLSFLSTSNISVTNSEFTNVRQAVAIGGGSNVVIAENNAHILMKTGFVLSGSSNVKITGNVISDIRPVNGEHPDAIQFFTSGTTVAAHDIVVSNNLIVKGAGAATQGIFFRDQVGTLPFQNVEITNNMVVGTGYGGIYVDGAKGLKISGNELISNPGDTNKTFLLAQRVDQATVVNNKAVLIGFDQATNLTQSGNVQTVAVTDSGSEAIGRWAVAHPEDVSIINSLHLTTLTATTSTQSPAVVQPVQAAPTPAPAPAVAPVEQTSTVTMGAADKSAVLTKAWQFDVVGNSLDNVITGNFQANKLYGGAGNDTLDGQGGSDTLYGGSGDDVYFVPNSMAVVVEAAGEGNDTVIARGEHTLANNVENLIIDQSTNAAWAGFGNALDNQITGNSGDNSLNGYAGNDTLSGGAGNDWLVGGAGNDRLIGGTGADQFTFSPGGGKDTIVDFGARGEHDRLDILAYLKAGLAPTVVDTGPDVLIKFTNGDSITLLGIEPTALKPWYAGWTI